MSKTWKEIYESMGEDKIDEGWYRLAVILVVLLFVPVVIYLIRRVGL